MIGQIGFQALKRSLIISATLVIAYLTGMVVAMYLLSFAFLGKTIAALGEVLLLPLFPGSYLGEVLLPQIDVFEQPKPAKLLLSIMLNIALYMVCIYPIVASSIELRTRK